MALTPTQVTKVKQYIAVYDSTMLTNANLDFVIEDSADSLSADCFGTQYEKAIAYLTMHTLTIASQTSTDRDATGSAVIQKTIGPITIKWATPSEVNSDKYWSLCKTTKYGLMFLDLLKASTLGHGISIASDLGDEVWEW